MKQYLPIVLGLACAGLVVCLFMMKQGDDARHDTDTGAIVDFSNRLELADAQISLDNGTLLSLSNHLDESSSAALTLSNHLAEAASTMAQNAEQITNLNRQVEQIAPLESKNQTLGRTIADLTREMAGLTNQIVSIQASLAQTNSELVQAHKDYALLENRLRQNVAKRVIAERKFNDAVELQTQLRKLKTDPAAPITSERIYSSMDVVVSSNGTFQVLSKDGY